MKLRTNGFKKLLISLTLAVSVLLAMPAAAEGRKCKRGQCSPEERVSRMQSKLNLTDQQAAQVKAIFESHQGQFERIKQEMQNTFTEDQRQAMKEARKARKGNKQARPSKEERAQRFAEMGISEGQMAQMKSLKKQMREERKLIHEELRSVLTPEQQATFDERKKKRKGRRGPRA